MRMSDWSSDVCSSDLDGGLEILLRHAPGAAVARAALDDLHVGLGQQAEHFCRLGGDVLGAGVTGHVQGGAALERAESLGQALLLGDVDDIFGNVEGDRKSVV